MGRTTSTGATSAGPSTRTQHEEYYGVDIDTPGEVARLQRLEQLNTLETVRGWAEEGIPVEAMGTPSDMCAYRQRKGTPVPWDVEQRNKRSKRRSERVQRVKQGQSAGSTQVPDSVRDVISAPGQQLDASIQRTMEDHMGEDFSDVRIHAGPKATRAAENINARAFTVGNHIAFNTGEYDPSSSKGQHLIAHELAHVRQQTSDAVSMLPQDDREVKVNPDPNVEKEAEETAQRVMQGGEVGIRGMEETAVHIERMHREIELGTNSQSSLYSHQPLSHTSANRQTWERPTHTEITIPVSEENILNSGRDSWSLALDLASLPLSSYNFGSSEEGLAGRSETRRGLGTSDSAEDQHITDNEQSQGSSDQVSISVREGHAQEGPAAGHQQPKSESDICEHITMMLEQVKTKSDSNKQINCLKKRLEKLGPNPELAEMRSVFETQLEAAYQMAGTAQRQIENFRPGLLRSGVNPSGRNQNGSIDEGLLRHKRSQINKQREGVNKYWKPSSESYKRMSFNFVSEAMTLAAICVSAILFVEDLDSDIDTRQESKWLPYLLIIAGIVGRILAIPVVSCPYCGQSQSRYRTVTGVGTGIGGLADFLQTIYIPNRGNEANGGSKKSGYSVTWSSGLGFAIGSYLDLNRSWFTSSDPYEQFPRAKCDNCSKKRGRTKTWHPLKYFSYPMNDPGKEEDDYDPDFYNYGDLPRNGSSSSSGPQYPH